jgi:hypothetical protein
MANPHSPDPAPARREGDDVPDGAAVFPLIPDELGIHPLLLATLHAIVFFDGSDAEVVNDAAANESLNYLATYLQRLQGPDLKRIRDDMDALLAFAKQEGWPQEEMQFLQGFLKEFGVGTDVG